MEGNSKTNRQVLSRLAEIRQWRNGSPSTVEERQELERRDMDLQNGYGYRDNLANGPEDVEGINFDYVGETTGAYQNTEETTDQNKPKRPFLKKGTGLARYNMNREDFVIYKNRYVRKSTKKNEAKKQPTTERPTKEQRIIAHPTSERETIEHPAVRTAEEPKKSILSPDKLNTEQENIDENFSKPRTLTITMKSRQNYPESDQVLAETGTHKQPSNTSETTDVKTRKNDPLKVLRLYSDEDSDSESNWRNDLEPLHLPDVAMEYKGKWFRESENQDDILHKPKLSDTELCEQRVPVQSFWKDDDREYWEVCKKFAQLSKDDQGCEEIYSPSDSIKDLYTDPDMSAMELKAFESLEKKVDQSSFCSTDSSIVQLLDGRVEKQSSFESGGYPADDEYVKHWKHIEPSPNEDRFEEYGNLTAVSSNQIEGLSRIHSEHSSTAVSDRLDHGGERDEIVRTIGRSTYKRQRRIQDFCEYCGSHIGAKLEEYERELDALVKARAKLESLKDEQEDRMLQFEQEYKMKQREIDEIKTQLEGKNHQDRGQVSNKEKKSLQGELSKAKQELASLRIELKETKDFMKVRESNHAVSLAKLRSTIKQLETKTANLQSEVDKFKSGKGKVVFRDPNHINSLQMNMMNELVQNMREMKNAAQNNAHIETNSAPQGAIKKEPTNNVEINLPGKRNVRKKNGKICAKPLPAKGGDANKKYSPKKNEEVSKQNGDNSHDANLMLPPLHPVKKAASRAKGNVEISERFSEASKSLLQGFGSMKKTLFFQDKKYARGSFSTDFSVSTNSVDEAIIKDILNEIVGKYNENKIEADKQQETVFDDGSKEIKYANGNVKIITAEGFIRYFYAAQDTWQTQKPDGSEILEYSDGQREERQTSRIYHIEYNDGLSAKHCDYTISEYPDGSYLRRNDVTGECFSLYVRLSKK